MKTKSKIKSVEELLLSEGGFKKQDLNNGIGKAFKKLLSKARLDGIRTGQRQIGMQTLGSVETAYDCLINDDSENAIMILAILKDFLDSAVT